MDYAVRPADLARDKDAVVAVWTRNFSAHSEAQHRDKYRWHYEDNPVGSGKCWVLEARGARDGVPHARIVGTAGLGLRSLRVAGETVTAGLASDFAVDVEHRSLRPALMLARAVVAEVGQSVRFIYGMPNAQSSSVFSRVGYAVGKAVKRYVKVLRVERFLREKLGSSLASRSLSVVAAPIARVASPETWRPGGGFALEEALRFDRRFDDLWTRWSADESTSSGPVTERTTKILEWRYGRCPLRRYTTLALVRRGQSRLAGYVVGFEDKDEQFAVVDVVTDRTEATETDLVAEVVRWARRRRFQSIACELYCAPELERTLRRLTFRYRCETPQLAFYAPGDGATLAALERWRFLRAEEDYN